jgi:hypothetical protein
VGQARAVHVRLRRFAHAMCSAPGVLHILPEGTRRRARTPGRPERAPAPRPTPWRGPSRRPPSLPPPSPRSSRATTASTAPPRPSTSPERCSSSGQQVRHRMLRRTPDPQRQRSRQCHVDRPRSPPAQGAPVGDRFLKLARKASRKFRPRSNGVCRRRSRPRASPSCASQLPCSRRLHAETASGDFAASSVARAWAASTGSSATSVTRPIAKACWPESLRAVIERSLAWSMPTSSRSARVPLMSGISPHRPSITDSSQSGAAIRKSAARASCSPPP